MSQPTVLLVEGEPGVRKVVRATLTRAGYEVLEAIDGRRAFDIAAEEAIDLVLLDLRLPDMPGVELARRMRELESGRALPIVAIAHASATLEHAQGFESLFGDFLLKPIVPARLLEVIGSLLPTSDARDALAGRHRLVLVADDDSLQRRATAIRFRRHGFRVREAVDGEEALEMALAEIPAAIVSDVLMPRLDGFRLGQTLRETPALQSVPLVLVSSRPVGASDAAMAKASGANAYVERSPTSEEAIETVLRLLDRPDAPTPPPMAQLDRTASDANVTEGDGKEDVDATSYRARLIRQLERQAQITSELTRLSNLQSAQLSVLAGVSETLTRTLDLSATLDEALARCMDVAAFSLGAAFLVSEDGVKLATSHGFPSTVRPALQTFFGHADLLRRSLDEEEIITLPSAQPRLKAAERLLSITATKALLLVPLAAGGQQLGVLVLASVEADPRRRGFAFARTIQGQLAQAILLAQSLDRLAASEHRFRRVAEGIAEGLLISDALGTVTFLNDAARRLLGVGSSAPASLRVDTLLPGIPLTPGSWEGVALALDGGQPMVRVSTSVAGGPLMERTHIVIDVTESRAAEAELRTLAEHDALTGLLNRRSFLDRLAESVSQRAMAGGALLFIDLDGFKAINDRHGHAAGDQVLERLADALTSRLRRGDVIDRIGGDEFAVLQEGADDRAALVLANQVLRIVRGLMTHINEAPVELGASIGVAVFPRDGTSADLLLERADAAMYETKRAGGDQVGFWAG